MIPLGTLLAFSVEAWWDKVQVRRELAWALIAVSSEFRFNLETVELRPAEFSSAAGAHALSAGAVFYSFHDHFERPLDIVCFPLRDAHVRTAHHLAVVWDIRANA